MAGSQRGSSWHPPAKESTPQKSDRLRWSLAMARRWVIHANQPGSVRGDWLFLPMRPVGRSRHSETMLSQRRRRFITGARPFALVVALLASTVVMIVATPTAASAEDCVGSCGEVSFEHVTARPDPSTYGTAIKFLVQIRDESWSCNYMGVCDYPVGHIEWYDGSATVPFARVALAKYIDHRSIAETFYSGLSAGSHDVRVRFVSSEDEEWEPNSTSLNVAVDTGLVGVTLSRSKTTTAPGEVFQLISSVSPSGAFDANYGPLHKPTGRVEFFDGGISLGTAVLDSTSTARFWTSLTGEWDHTLIARYLGDGDFEPELSPWVTHSVRATAPLPTLAVGDVRITEGDTGVRTAFFPVSLSEPSSSTVSLNYSTASGAAVAPDDFTTASSTLSFAAGEVSKFIGVPIRGDTLEEPSEGFRVSLLRPVNATIADGVGAGIIRDDDPQSERTITISDVTNLEGKSGGRTFSFTVSLSKAAASPVTVNFATADGSAVAPSDYIARTGTLTFDPGVVSHRVTVTTKPDTVFELNETFRVRLSGATGPATVTDAVGVGTLTNDDA